MTTHASWIALFQQLIHGCITHRLWHLCSRAFVLFSCCFGIVGGVRGCVLLWPGKATSYCLCFSAAVAADLLD